MLEGNPIFQRNTQLNLFQTFSRTYTKHNMILASQKHAKTIQAPLNAHSEIHMNMTSMRMDLTSPYKLAFMRSKESSLQQQPRNYELKRRNVLNAQKNVLNASNLPVQLREMVRPPEQIHYNFPRNEFLKRRLNCNQEYATVENKTFALKNCGVKPQPYHQQFQNDQTDFSILALDKKIQINSQKNMKSRLFSFTNANSTSAFYRSATTKRPKYLNHFQEKLSQKYSRFLDPKPRTVQPMKQRGKSLGFKTEARPFQC